MGDWKSETGVFVIIMDLESLERVFPSGAR